MILKNFINTISQFFYKNRVLLEEFDIGSEVVALSEAILSKEEIIEAEQLALAISAGGKRKEYAIAILQKKIGLTPKRPIYYITLQFLPHLPSYTRDIMRYLGDYLDGIVKFATVDILKQDKYQKKSLGTNLRDIKNKIPNQLFLNLYKYNQILYVPAKHDFKVNDREHRFTTIEVVITCLLTLRLAEELKKISLLAGHYCEDTLPKKYW